MIFVEAFFEHIYVPERWPLILGGVFVVIVMFLRGGLPSIWLILEEGKLLMEALKIEGVSKNFGGIQVLKIFFSPLNLERS